MAWKGFSIASALRRRSFTRPVANGAGPRQNISEGRAVVIGAGPGGLATALQLAGAGLQVTVLERNGRVGGRTAAIEANGFRFDTGPTFFLYPRVLEEIFASVGQDLRAEVPMTQLDPQYRLVFGAGGELLATPNVRRMQQEVAKFSRADADTLPRFLADNRRKLDSFRPILESPFLGWRDLLRPELLSSAAYVRPWNSLDRELGRFFRDPRIRLAFSFQSKYLGMSPFQCPSLFSILSFIEYEFGVFHPLGGCNAIPEAMARILRHLGGEIRLSEPAERIEFQGRRAVGVRTARRYYPADAVVLNADFPEAIRRLTPDRLRRRWTNQAIERKKYSCSTFMMYLGVDGAYPNIPHHNIYISEEYEQNLRDIETLHTLSEDPSFYLQNASVSDPSLAPPGSSALYLLIPVSHEHPNIDWEKERSGFRRLALEQLRKVGVEDVEKRIRFEKTATPADWSSEHALYRGATFSLAHHLSQMLHLRPRNRFEDLDGVYLVGGGTHPGSGLPVIFESSRITSKLLLEDLGKRRLYRRPARPAEPMREVA